MAQSRDVKDREYSKFIESPTRSGESASEVVATVLNEANPFSVPTDADAFTREVIGNSVVYKFRQGGVSGSILKTVTIYYSSPQDPSLTGGEIS